MKKVIGLILTAFLILSSFYSTSAQTINKSINTVQIKDSELLLIAGADNKDKFCSFVGGVGLVAALCPPSASIGIAIMLIDLAVCL